MVQFHLKNFKMANVVITDTDKAGWVKFVYNDYYHSRTDHKEQFQRKTDVSAVDSINGVAPTSLTDLRDKILALL